MRTHWLLGRIFWSARQALVTRRKKEVFTNKICWPRAPPSFNTFCIHDFCSSLSMWVQNLINSWIHIQWSAMENGGATAKYSLHKIGVKFNHKNHLSVSFSRWQLLVQMVVTLGNSWLVLLVNNYFFLLRNTSKKSRRSSGRRVSFAEKNDIK